MQNLDHEWLVKGSIIDFQTFPMKFLQSLKAIQTKNLRKKCSDSINKGPIIKDATRRFISIKPGQTGRNVQSKNNNHIIDYPLNEEDDDELSFFLKKKLIKHNELKQYGTKGKKSIEIIKYKGDHIEDVRFLHAEEKYFVRDKNGRFCLVKNVSSIESYFYFDIETKGEIRGADGEKVMDVQEADKKILNKKRQIYSALIPDEGAVSINDGYYDYILRKVDQGRAAYSSSLNEDKKKSGNFFFRSFAIHLFTFFLVSQFSQYEPPSRHYKREKSHFVRVDISKLKVSKKESHKNKVRKKKIKKKLGKNVSNSKKVKKVNRKKRLSWKERIFAARHKVKKSSTEKSNPYKAGILSAIGLSGGINLSVSEALAAVTEIDKSVNSKKINSDYKIGDIFKRKEKSEIGIKIQTASEVFSNKKSAIILKEVGANGLNMTEALVNNGNVGLEEIKGLVSSKFRKKFNRNIAVRGGMSRKVVKKVIEEHFGEINFCYESELIDNPNLSGKVVFEWTILQSGKVGRIGAKSSLFNSKNIYSCIGNAIKSWQFPRPKGKKVVVSYPFIFDVVGF